MKYRKKPVVIDAIQWNGDFIENDEFIAPDWIEDAIRNGTLFFNQNGLHIKTLEGIHHCSIGDFIIRGVNGELYPCKPDIFEKTYELID